MIRPHPGPDDGRPDPRRPTRRREGTHKATAAMGGAAHSADDDLPPPQVPDDDDSGPRAPDHGQRRRGNGGRRRRSGAEGGRAAGTGRVARRTAGGGGAERRQSVYDILLLKNNNNIGTYSYSNRANVQPPVRPARPAAPPRPTKKKTAWFTIAGRHRGIGVPPVILLLVNQVASARGAPYFCMVIHYQFQASLINHGMSHIVMAGLVKRLVIICIIWQ